METLVPMMVQDPLLSGETQIRRLTEGFVVKSEDFFLDGPVCRRVAVLDFDPTTGEQKRRKDLPYPNSAGVLTTVGGVVVTALLDGTIVALDDQTLEELWKINVGTGFNAPPMTYAVNGKQYVAIASGLWRNANNKLSRSPEMRTASQATVIWVFGL